MLTVVNFERSTRLIFVKIAFGKLGFALLLECDDDERNCNFTYLFSLSFEYISSSTANRLSSLFKYKFNSAQFSPNMLTKKNAKNAALCILIFVLGKTYERQ